MSYKIISITYTDSDSYQKGRTYEKVWAKGFNSISEAERYINNTPRLRRIINSLVIKKEGGEFVRRRNFWGNKWRDY